MLNHNNKIILIQQEVQKYQTEVKDHKIQIKLNEKKHRNLVKELQQQVQKERYTHTIPEHKNNSSK